MGQGTARPQRLWDVVVAGGGMAGLSAALAAAEHGAAVLVLEKANRPGGNANFSAGMFLGSSDFEGMRAYIPDGDAELQRMHCRRFLEALSWLEGHGLPFGAPIARGDFRVTRPMAAGAPGDRSPFMRALADRAISLGADLRLKTALRNIRRDGSEFRIETDAGRLSARAVILATGGFQANRRLLARYFGPEPAAHLRLRSVPECTGDGLELALRLGARESVNMAAFYGHSMADAEMAMADFQPMTPYFARNALLVNRLGRRFVDESSSLLEEVNPQEGCRQSGGVYYLLFDRHMYSAEGRTPGSHVAELKVDWLGRAAALNFPLFRAETIDGLISILAAEGIPAGALGAELEAYNEAARKGTHAALTPPREENAFVFEQPPFYALRCVAGITATCGGIAVDTAGRVKDKHGGIIEGLFAAGVDAGGVYGRRYGGFLGWALTSGRGCGAAAAGKRRQ